MEYGICILSAIPVRETIQHESEMTTQMLFGELCIIEDKFQSWLRIRTQYDLYEGWVDAKQIEIISEEIFVKLTQDDKYLTADDYSCAIAQETGSFPLKLTLGAVIPNFANGKFILKGIEYHYSGNIAKMPSAFDISQVQNIAFKYINAPYLWGGRSLFGIDCSGFTQMVMKFCGLKLPRNASQQAELGQTVNFFTEAQQGDLFFFDNENGNIVHAGIYLGNGQIIHASGTVRIDAVDHQGIFQKEKGIYSHKLRVIKSFR